MSKQHWKSRFPPIPAKHVDQRMSPRKPSILNQIEIVRSRYINDKSLVVSRNQSRNTSKSSLRLNLAALNFHKPGDLQSPRRKNNFVIV